MQTALKTLLANVEGIRAEGPTYRNGGTGKDGTCDCIGLIMGAMYRAGRADYPMHSTNYFARYQMEDFGPVSGTGALYLGELLFKARGPTESGYDLSATYLAGGRYWTGDTLDYYHVGIVTSLAPLVITHCTSSGGISGVTTDSRLGKWAYGGRLKGVLYTTATEEGESMALTGKTCTVTGGALNLRRAPDKAGGLIVRIPEGAAVYCVSDGGTWAQVKYDTGTASYTGYVMSQYLQEAADQNGDTTADAGTVTVTLTAAEAAALKSLAGKL